MSIYEEYVSFKKALLIAVFKLSFTQVFGIYSGFVYISTGSLWPVILLHSQCNFFGFPSFQNLMNQDFRRSERILVLILYIAGVIIVFRCFDWFVAPDLSRGEKMPWWITSSTAGAVQEEVAS